MSLKRKQNPKKKKKINVKKRDNGVSYVCCNCGVEEKRLSKLPDGTVTIKY